MIPRNRVRFASAAALSLCALLSCGGEAGPTAPETLRLTSESSSSERPVTSTASRRPSARVVVPRGGLKSVTLGIWGGDHVQLTLTPSGGTLEYDCGSGTIDQLLLIDPATRLDVIGTHTRGKGGPIVEGEPPDRHPARYTGTTDGKTMVLTVKLTDTGETVGTFTLTQGQAGRLVRCL